MQILKDLEGADYEVDRGQEGRAYQEGAASVYNQYLAAGGFQGAELFYPEDHASCPAAL